ncbi:hypothetical protein HPB50_006200 [Hyalomma asiaticum]|uniref:Uncharacterized protein n=1 Tax=Hyalomma asiaticum TaxID=266040 RepID=A0ACB7RSS0_HYAAI|nr:hypothetical protein HPB50_006200 [Hyalomma asiaticum]
MAEVRLAHVLVALCGLGLFGCLVVTRLGYVHVRVNWPQFRDIADIEVKHSVAFNDVALVRPPVSEKMTLVFVICENHFDLGIVAVKSAVAYSTTRLHLIVIADKYNQKRMRTESMLSNEDAVLYVDTDVVFVHPVEDFWRKFYAMNEWQMAGMAPETEDVKLNYYLTKALHPFVKPFALNAGLLMMNLTRMRAFDLEKRVMRLKQEYEGRIPWADQDLLNILFAQYPQGLFTFTCRWNYRGEHCHGEALCADGPIAVVHASRKMILDRLEPAFVALHRLRRHGRRFVHRSKIFGENFTP